MLVIGLMSGTSLDGVDAALVRFDDEAGGTEWRIEAFLTRAYRPAERETIRAAIQAGTAAALCRLNVDLGEWLAEAALAVCDAAGIDPDQVDLIGSHGQTVWHQPPGPGKRGATLQIGCAATIAERTGVTVISDFRARDVAAGGHGAPLVPRIDDWLFAAVGRSRVLVNIGGMANLTRVGPQGAGQPIVAFDTGPGNALIDAAVQLASAGAEAYDRDGARASAGQVVGPWLTELMAHPFIAAEPPKSTGREVFGGHFVEQCVRRWQVGGARWDDFVATLTAFTARSIADAVARFARPLGVDEVVVTGGGASNPVLLEWIADALAPLPVIDSRSAGIDPDAKEAVAFAALARAHELGVPGNVPAVTGARGPRVLGCRTPGRNGSREAERA